jgi:hypothetical protein
MVSPPNRDRLTMRVVLLKRLGPHPELVEVDLTLKRNEAAKAASQSVLLGMHP